MIPDLYTDRLRYIFQNMDEAICITRKDGDLLYTNPRARKLFDIRKDRPGKIWDSIPYVEGNDDLIQLFIDAVMKKKKTVRSLVRYVNNTGDNYQLHISLTCEAEEDGLILIVINDMTEMIRLHSAFVRYTSPEIADYVLNTPEGEKQGGQTRDVSILISDLRGFTALSIQVSSSGLIRIINHFFECMGNVIRQYRGTVIEFLGDGIFVVFGAPEDLPDHASAAVNCAIGMQNAMAEVNEWNRSQGYPELSMGIGIHSGPAVVGNIGSENKMKYGCMGETVNLTGRIESLSVGGQILVSGTTKERMKEKLTVAGEQVFRPKGMKKDMTVYTVTGLGRNHALKDPQSEIRWISLPRSRELLFFSVEGKSVEPEPRTGCLTAVSEDEQSGLLNTEFGLKPMQNLMLKIGEHEVYAKVLKADTTGYWLCFTPKPEELISLLDDSGESS